MTPTTTIPQTNTTELLSLCINQQKISTGSKNIDELIDGGIEFGKLTEVSGPFGTGKTNLGMSLIINLYKQNSTNKTIIIDTENKFDLRKLKEFSERNDINHINLFQNIILFKPKNVEEQKNIIINLNKLIKNDENIKLIIVDSMTSLLRSEFAGRENLTKRQQYLGEMIYLLNLFSVSNNLAVYVTNQITANPDSNAKNNVIPLGGNYMAHHSHTRILLRHGVRGKNIAELIHSTYLPHGETNFSISSKGINDP